MAGISNFSDIGALSNSGEGIADINARRPVPASISSPTPGGGRLEGGANAGFAIGDLYNSYKKAQLDSVTQETQLAKANRDRLTQIWQAGQANPALQNDPRIHKQIAQAWKGMTGSEFPVQPGQPFDWNTLQPPKSIAELSGPMLTMLQQANPTQRRALAKSMGLVDATDAFLDAPAVLSQAAQNRVRQDLSNMMAKAGSDKGLDPKVFQSWIDTNRDDLDQVFGEGRADKILHDPEMFDLMQKKMQEGMDKVVAQTTHIKGLSTKDQAQIKLIAQQVTNAKTMDDLLGVKMKVLNAQLKDIPGIDAAKINQMNANAAKSRTDATLAAAKVQEIKASGGASPMGELTKQLAAEQKNLDYATAAYKTAVGSGMGVPEDIQDAYDTARGNVQLLQSGIADLSSPATQAAIRAVRLRNVNPALAPVTTDGPGHTYTPGQVPAGAKLDPHNPTQYFVPNPARPGYGTMYDLVTGKPVAGQ